MSQLVQETLQLILLALISVIVPVLAFQAYTWLQSRIAAIRSGISVDQNFVIDELITIVVKAIEQTHLKEQLFASGEEMLQAAIDLAQKMLDARGLNYINLDELEARIRAALRDGVHKAEGDEPTKFS